MSGAPHSALWLTVAATADRLLEVGRRLAVGCDGDGEGDGGEDVLREDVNCVDGAVALLGETGVAGELLTDWVELCVPATGAVWLVVAATDFAAGASTGSPELTVVFAVVAEEASAP